MNHSVLLLTLVLAPAFAEPPKLEDRARALVTALGKEDFAAASKDFDDAIKETEVTVGKGEWVLPGTLPLPTGDGPFPAVVLVHGSGPHDRDETIGPSRPFRDLAGGLASQGIAVLRYEKRTKEHAAKL